MCWCLYGAVAVCVIVMLVDTLGSKPRRDGGDLIYVVSKADTCSKIGVCE